MISHFVNDVSEFFDTDYKSVSILIGLDGLLDTHLISIHRQVNQDQWKFKLKDADNVQWLSFKDCSSAKLLARSDMFKEAKVNGNLNTIWKMLEKAIVQAADTVFSRIWYSEYNCSKNKQSSKFFKLKLLVVKVVWLAIDVVEAFKVDGMLVKHLSIIRKEYHKSKYYESKIAENTAIRKTIDYYIENFCSDKGKIIKSILEYSFYKMVLDHLVVDDELVIELNKIKLKISNELWKHCGGEVLACLLNLLNLCLSISVVSNLWKEVWWNGVLTNTRPIALVKTTHKILSKILFDWISLTLLKGTLTQSPIFAIGSVIKNALKKNRELWLVLQDMHKAYDSVDWHHLQMDLHCIKICERFIQFFSNIHENWVNKVMTDFGLSDVKRHKHLCGYRIDSKFVAKSGRIEASEGKTSFLAADAFVDDMIWRVKNALLLINGLPILIAKKSELHQYLGIFLLTESFSKPSLAQAHKDIRFFSNIVLRKTIMNKQFCYLVLAVLQPIVSYHIQFSFVTLDVYHKWDIMIRKGFRAKAGLLCDFPSKILHHPSLYGLKPFEQVQFEGKLALLISFSNGHSILEHLFNHKFLNLQVLGWSPLNPLQFLIKLHVSFVNNFLAEVVKIFLENELSLTNNLPCAFHGSGDFPMSDLVPYRFFLTSDFMNNSVFLGVKAATTTKEDVLSVLDSNKFSEVHNSLLEVWSDCIEIYTDRSLRYVGSVEVAGGAAAYFLAANTGIRVKITGLLSSTLTKLQTMVLALKCVPFSCSIVLYLNSQSVIDACISEAFLITPDFHNQCWIKRLQIVNLLKDKNISIKWVKVKRHSNVLGNVRTNALANETIFLSLFLSVKIWKRFLVTEKTAISSNICHFAQNLYQSICCAYWKTGLGFDIVPNIMIKKIDWNATMTIWHPDLHMFFEFTSRKSANLCTYLMKIVYRQLLVTVRKRLYNRSYLGVLCLLCDEMEFSNHVFACSGDFGLRGDILVKATEK
ncbi:hypothetical protein G9A89_021098 [Geosiphon pyriformis]|nr:hypothetical protein G9A89_021098 [Geosiphon pyriformis]